MVTSNVSDWNFNDLKDFGEFAKCMRGKQCLIKYTNIAIDYTCYGLVEVCQYLIKSDFNFIMLREVIF